MLKDYKNDIDQSNISNNRFSNGLSLKPPNFNKDFPNNIINTNINNNLYQNSVFNPILRSESINSNGTNEFRKGKRTFSRYPQFQSQENYEGNYADNYNYNYNINQNGNVAYVFNNGNQGIVENNPEKELVFPMGTNTIKQNQIRDKMKEESYILKNQLNSSTMLNFEEKKREAKENSINKEQTKLINQIINKEKRTQEPDKLITRNVSQFNKCYTDGNGVKSSFLIKDVYDVPFEFNEVLNKYDKNNINYYQSLHVFYAIDSKIILFWNPISNKISSSYIFNSRENIVKANIIEISSSVLYNDNENINFNDTTVHLLVAVSDNYSVYINSLSEKNGQILCKRLEYNGKLDDGTIVFNITNICQNRILFATNNGIYEFVFREQSMNPLYENIIKIDVGNSFYNIIRKFKFWEKNTFFYSKIAHDETRNLIYLLKYFYPKGSDPSLPKNWISSSIEIYSLNENSKNFEYLNELKLEDYEGSYGLEDLSISGNLSEFLIEDIIVKTLFESGEFYFVLLLKNTIKIFVSLVLDEDYIEEGVNIPHETGNLNFFYVLKNYTFSFVKNEKIRGKKYNFPHLFGSFSLPKKNASYKVETLKIYKQKIEGKNITKYYQKRKKNYINLYKNNEEKNCASIYKGTAGNDEKEDGKNNTYNNNLDNKTNIYRNAYKNIYNLSDFGLYMCQYSDGEYMYISLISFEPKFLQGNKEKKSEEIITHLFVFPCEGDDKFLDFGGFNSSSFSSPEIFVFFSGSVYVFRKESREEELFSILSKDFLNFKFLSFNIENFFSELSLIALKQEKNNFIISLKKYIDLYGLVTFVNFLFSILAYGKKKRKIIYTKKSKKKYIKKEQNDNNVDIRSNIGDAYNNNVIEEIESKYLCIPYAFDNSEEGYNNEEYEGENNNNIYNDNQGEGIISSSPFSFLFFMLTENFNIKIKNAENVRLSLLSFLNKKLNELEDYIEKYRNRDELVSVLRELKSLHKEMNGLYNSIYIRDNKYERVETNNPRNNKNKSIIPLSLDKMHNFINIGLGIFVSEKISELWNNFIFIRKIVGNENIIPVIFPGIDEKSIDDSFKIFSNLKAYLSSKKNDIFSQHQKFQFTVSKLKYILPIILTAKINLQKFQSLKNEKNNKFFPSIDEFEKGISDLDRSVFRSNFGYLLNEIESMFSDELFEEEYINILNIVSRMCEVLYLIKRIYGMKMFKLNLEKLIETTEENAKNGKKYFDYAAIKISDLFEGPKKVYIKNYLDVLFYSYERTNSQEQGLYMLIENIYKNCPSFLSKTEMEGVKGRLTLQLLELAPRNSTTQYKKDEIIRESIKNIRNDLRHLNINEIICPLANEGKYKEIVKLIMEKIDIINKNCGSPSKDPNTRRNEEEIKELYEEEEGNMYDDCIDKIISLVGAAINSVKYKSLENYVMKINQGKEVKHSVDEFIVILFQGKSLEELFFLRNEIINLILQYNIKNVNEVVIKIIYNSNVQGEFEILGRPYLQEQILKSIEDSMPSGDKLQLYQKFLICKNSGNLNTCYDSIKLLVYYDNSILINGEVEQLGQHFIVDSIGENNNNSLLLYINRENEDKAVNLNERIGYINEWIDVLNKSQEKCLLNVSPNSIEVNYSEQIFSSDSKTRLSRVIKEHLIKAKKLLATLEVQTFIVKSLKERYNEFDGYIKRCKKYNVNKEKLEKLIVRVRNINDIVKQLSYGLYNIESLENLCKIVKLCSGYIKILLTKFEFRSTLPNEVSITKVLVSYFEYLFDDSFIEWPFSPLSFLNESFGTLLMAHTHKSLFSIYDLKELGTIVFPLNRIEIFICIIERINFNIFFREQKKKINSEIVKNKEDEKKNALGLQNFFENKLFSSYISEMNTFWFPIFLSTKVGLSHSIIVKKYWKVFSELLMSFPSIKSKLDKDENIIFDNNLIDVEEIGSQNILSEEQVIKMNGNVNGMYTQIYFGFLKRNSSFNPESKDIQAKISYFAFIIYGLYYKLCRISTETSSETLLRGDYPKSEVAKRLKDMEYVESLLRKDKLPMKLGEGEGIFREGKAYFDNYIYKEMEEFIDIAKNYIFGEEMKLLLYGKMKNISMYSRNWNKEESFI